jgi:HJR/Mrr/RecB family endonuclease
MKDNSYGKDVAGFLKELAALSIKYQIEIVSSSEGAELCTKYKVSTNSQYVTDAYLENLEMVEN